MNTTTAINVFARAVVLAPMTTFLHILPLKNAPDWFDILFLRTNTHIV